LLELELANKHKHVFGM